MGTTVPSSAEARPERLPPGAGPNGWLAFAGVMLFLVGFMEALFGLTAILNSEVVTVGGTGVVIWDFTAWGWVTLVLGLTMAFTGVGLFLGRTVARWLAVGFVSANVVLQVTTVSAFPLWGVLIVVLDVVILYQLLARWQLEA